MAQNPTPQGGDTSAGAVARAPAGIFSMLGNVAIFLVALAVSCGVIGRLLPFPDVPMVREKLEFLARHGDEYDALFIGSSRVHYQIMPAVFDHLAGESGLRIKSFNVGVAGMKSPEDGYVLEQILQRPHRRLRWVFIELSRLATGAERDATARFGYWHDTPRLWLVSRRLYSQWQEALARYPQAGFWLKWDLLREPFGHFCEHTRQWMSRAVNLGRGSSLLARIRDKPPTGRDIEKHLGKKSDGWKPTGLDKQTMATEMRATYDRIYAERLAAPAAKERGDPVSQETLERTIRTIVKSGATPILIVPPTLFERNFYPVEEREKQLVILDFADVRKYPVLFTPEHRLDVDHVNTPGAEAFTKLLARAFLDRGLARLPEAP